MKQLNFYLTLSLLALTLSCGGDGYDGGSNDPQQQAAAPYDPENFQTRIDPNLAVNGSRCSGGVAPIPVEIPDNVCEDDEWLIQLDDQNTCSADLSTCTEIGVFPTVAKLDLQESISNNDFSYYRIAPEAPVSAGQQRIINRVWVRTAPNGDTEAVLRNIVR